MILNKFKPAFTIPVRTFQCRNQPHVDGVYRGQNIKRYGYEPHHHTKGLLPRLSIPEKRLGFIPTTAKESRWSTRNSRMGENDCVRVFGDDSIRQYELLTHIPEWLRGYRARNEYSVLMIKRRAFENWKESKPQKWKHMQERIRFLYRRINNKYNPPRVEKLPPSRYVG